MEYLARKFERPKWVLKDYLLPDKISAYAVTYCLKAQDDTLSFWSCELHESDSVNDVVLALASTMQQLETIDLVLFHKEELRLDSVELEQRKDSKCPVTDLGERHFDAVKLDLTKLALVARRIADKARRDQDEHCVRITLSRVRGIVSDAVTNGRVDPTRLSQKVRDKIDPLTGRVYG
jgi:hypothetical protein